MLERVVKDVKKHPYRHQLDNGKETLFLRQPLIFVAPFA